MRHSASRLISTICCGLAAALFTGTLQAQVAEDSGQVTVSGKQLLRDGVPWIPHGFYQVPFEVSPGAFNLPNQNSFWQAAYDGFSPQEYVEMKAQGADSVRLQIAQNGADPENHKFFDSDWLRQAIGAIQSARALGLTVIVSIQDEPQTGVAREAPLPDNATRRVWRELAPIFGQDRGILFELYNEPDDLPISDTNPDTDRPPTPRQWQRWANAMNETIAFVRALGAVNVVVADGLVHAQQLAGAPILSDSLNQVVYAAHPYVSGAQAVADYNQTAQAWDEKFGNFSRTAPVIISEWGIGFFCDSKTPASVVKFLQYLQDHGIGLEAGIWDFAGPGFNNLTHGFPGVRFSSFVNSSGKTCTLNNAPGGYGPGKTVESWYLTGVPPATPQ